MAQTVMLHWWSAKNGNTLTGHQNVYDGHGDFECDVLTVSPPIVLPWTYTDLVLV